MTGQRRSWGAPPGAVDISSPGIRCVVAVVAGAQTVREVAGAVGFRSSSTPYHHLQHARRLGLVDWQDGQSATLHPLVGVVPVLELERP